MPHTFPLSAKYSPEWVIASTSGGANALWLTEWLASKMDLRPGMRILDLGCGRAASSIFLNREFGVEVWATDLWFSASENLQRIRDAGAQERVFPIHTDARNLPFANEFFDAVVSIDSFVYYGTDDTYLNYLARFVKPGGQIGIVGAGLVKEIVGPIPSALDAWWETNMCCLHSAEWWKRHWERSKIVTVELADTMPEGWKIWRDWHIANYPDNTVEIEALNNDNGEYLGYPRVICRRNLDVILDEPISSMPTEYKSVPLFITHEK